MTVSDIITLVSLVIAIVAILSEKNRRHLLLKFHLVDFLLFGLSFVLINYFVFYDYFYSKDIFISQLYFSSYGIHNPNNYAYIIAISSILYFFYKILYAFYPFGKISSVSKFYGHLIENGETSFLLDLIDRYHKNDIIKVVQRSDDYKSEDYSWQESFHPETLNKVIRKWFSGIFRGLFPYSWSNRKAYAQLVLHSILNDPAFIMLASNMRPYMFSEILATFNKNKRNSFPNELVNTFLHELLKHKNFWLKKELQQSQKHDYGQPEIFHVENRILSALLRDLSVSDVNGVWRPFGKIAIDEIEEERINGYESKMFQEFREEEFLWEFRTYFTIQFFKIIVIEALVKKYSESHFWLYNYRSITHAILKTFEKCPPDDFENVKTVYHKFIDIMIDNCFLWLRISNEKEDIGFYENILTCLGDVVLEVTNSPYFGTKDKVSYIDRLFTFYCNLYNNRESDRLRLKVGELILKPTLICNRSDNYYNYVELAWKQFDKIPHRLSGVGKDLDYAYFKRFKKEVIIPLGLNPDIY
jgi:hypothetical protein